MSNRPPMPTTASTAGIHDLPAEVLTDILGLNSIACIYRFRRVSTRWKDVAEAAFAIKLRTYHGGSRQFPKGENDRGPALFTLTLILLSSKGGPWFHVPRRITNSPDNLGIDRRNGSALASDGIEDVKVLRLRVASVDPQSKTISLQPDEDDVVPLLGRPRDMDDDILASSRTSTLHRCPTLDRHEWILKGLLRCDPSLDTTGAKRVDPLVSAGPFTLVSTEMDIGTGRVSSSSPGGSGVGKNGAGWAKNTLTSFEMIAEYTVRDRPSSRLPSGIHEENGDEDLLGWSNDLLPPPTSPAATAESGPGAVGNHHRPPDAALDVCLDTLKVSYSYLFAAMCTIPANAQRPGTTGAASDYPATPATSPASFSPLQGQTCAFCNPLHRPFGPHLGFIGTGGIHHHHVHHPHASPYTPVVRPAFIKSLPIPEDARISVFAKAQVDMLKARAGEVGLKWSNAYWSFDVVLHWLKMTSSTTTTGTGKATEETEGGRDGGKGVPMKVDRGSADGEDDAWFEDTAGREKTAAEVVQYLVEYEKVMEDSRTKRRQAKAGMMRFYSL
ncbi:hypothetical protein HK101_007053 [Irineochytrium annulatum]|nr:hypothetical protein HK101_007053 [Irineochytrium annulatum]